MNESERLAAESRIRACRSRYTEGVDTKNWALFASAFAHDGVWDERGSAIARNPATGDWNPVGCEVDFEVLEQMSHYLPWPIVGRDAIRAAVEQGANDFTSFHAVFNPAIEVMDESSARAKWPFEDILHFHDGGPITHMRGYGYYHETYVCEDGQWLIQTSSLSRLICYVS